MSKSKLLGSLLVAAAASGCCDEHVKARAFVGHLSGDECARKISLAEPPVTILCPGTEVTVCWIADTKDVTINVTPDIGGNTGTYPAQGTLYLTPTDNTVIDITASDCASTSKQVQVINGPTPATFDGKWDASCSVVSYELNPAFVDQNVLTTDVTALWEPTAFDRFNKQTVTCSTPPFLDGFHPEDLHGFSIDKPFITHVFGHTLHGPTNWNYQLKACSGLDTSQCNHFESKEFGMTLVCPGQ